MVRQFHDAGFMVDLNNDQGTTLNKKIRSAQLAQYNYIFGKDHYDETVSAYYTKASPFRTIDVLIPDFD